jgi:hypothetical protein
MATTKNASENFSMDDFDALLAALTPDDLDKVNDLIDPEVMNSSDFIDLLIDRNE